MKTFLRSPINVVRALLLAAAFMAVSQFANADCASPAGKAGDQGYAANYGTMVFCNGTNWVSMAGGVSVTVNASGGGATPAGSSADVQFNSSGALAADTGNFTYSAGLLKAPNISATAITASGAGTFGTIDSTGLGTLGSLIVTGGATVTGQASITTVSTSLIQIGNNGAACSAVLAGAQRYNSVSNTIDYCTGSAWMSLGPSATVVPSFSAYMSVDQSVVSGANTKVVFGAERFDTNNNFDTGTSKFSPNIPGLYLVNANLFCSAATSGCQVELYKNGSAYQISQILGAGDLIPTVTALVQMNGTTDYLEVYGISYDTTSPLFKSGAVYSTFSGSLLTVNGGGGGGGTANPAGSTNDIQFNSGGLLAADTGNFTYASSTLTAPKVSTGALTVIGVSSLTTVSAITISATYVQIPSATNVLSCGSNLAGTMRYTSGTMQVCDGSGWTNIGLGVPQGTIAAFALTSCPNGWSEYTPARGRFLRGIDNGASVDPSGTRIPGDQQADALQNITGSYGAAGAVSFQLPSGAFYTDGALARLPSSASGNLATTMHFDASLVARTSTETRPANVAVIFCRYDGFQSQLQTGVATLASLTDVSVAGATTGQVLTYSAGTWIASSTTGGGASGDRITSGTLSIIANTGSAYASLTTNGTTWGYLSSNASYLPTLQTGFENNGTISTTLIQTGTNSATCSSGLYGSIRWNATSDTIQVCNSGGWISVASSTVPNTTISQGQNNYAAIFSGPNTLVTDSALYVDRTNHHVGIGTAAPGYTLAVSGSIVASSSAAYSGLAVKGGGPNDGSEISIGNDIGSIFGIIAGGSSNPGFPNGLFFYDNQLAKTRMAFFADGNSTLSGNLGLGTNSPGSSLTVVAGEIQTGYSGSACNSATNGGAIRYASGSLYYCNGSNTWTSIGGGGGSPAGSTGDIQFNNAGAFAADTGKLFWDATNNYLGIGTSAPIAPITVSGSNGTDIARISAVNDTGGARLEMRMYGSTDTTALSTGGVARGGWANLTANGGLLNGMAIGVWLNKPLLFMTNSTEQMRLDENGNLGLGTSSPTRTLDVSGTARIVGTGGQLNLDTTASNQQAIIQLYNAGTNKWQIGKQSTTDQFFIYDVSATRYAMQANSGGDMALMPNGGNVGIGKTTPLVSLEVSTSTGLRASTYNGTYYATTLLANQLYTYNTPLYINYASTSNTIINANGGSVGIATTAPGAPLEISGSNALRLSGTSTAHAPYMEWFAGGTRQAFMGWGVPGSSFNIGIENGNTFGITASSTTFTGTATATAFLYSSDRRLKGDITNLTGGLAKLDALNPVSFRFTSDPSKTIHLGLIAQDVQRVYPEAVHTDDKGYLKLDYPALIGPVVGMLKELKSIVFADHGDLVEAKAEILQLKADNDNLEAANRTLKAANDNAMRRLDALERTQRAHGW